MPTADGSTLKPSTPSNEVMGTASMLYYGITFKKIIIIMIVITFP